MSTVLEGPLPPPPVFRNDLRRAPRRQATLTREQVGIALGNALRYIPTEHHAALAPEFLEELRQRGRIYGYRYRPAGAITGDKRQAHVIDHSKCIRCDECFRTCRFDAITRM